MAAIKTRPTKKQKRQNRRSEWSGLRYKPFPRSRSKYDPQVCDAERGVRQ